MRRLRAAIDQAKRTAAHADKSLSKADALLDVALALLEDLQDDGIELTLEVGNRELPIKLKLQIGDDDK